MKSFSLLAVGLLSTAVAADPNGHHKHRKHNGSECMQLLASEHLLAEANNTALMQRYQSNYPDKAAMIKDKTQEANTLKKTIESNSSHPADWLSNCHIKGAHMQLIHQCMERDFLPKKLKKWNDPKKGPAIQKHFKWTEAQFTQEKGVIESKIKDLNNNQTLSEKCVTLPKDHKGGKGDKGPDGKEGAKPDGKGDKGKGPDGKPAGE
jgi:hypothetical protein